MTLWSPGAITARAKKGGRAHLAHVVRKQAHVVQSRGLPAILTLNHLAQMAGVEFDALRDFVRRKDDPYTGYRVKKRRGGYRNIVCPPPNLKRVQRWLSQHVLNRIEPHTASKAYAKGSKPIEVARLHCGASWLIKIDITSFFESISEIDIYRVFRSCDYSSLVSFELARLCTRVTDGARYRRPPWTLHYWRSKIRIYRMSQVGHLPQGAPTSPMLANLVFRGLDEQITKLIDGLDLTYSRYSDDLIFSTTRENFTRRDAEDLVREVEGLLSKRGFRTNANKTTIAPPGARKVVLGLVVNDSIPHLPKRFKDALDIHLYFAEKRTIAAHAKLRGFVRVSGFLAHLHGLITYAESVEPERGRIARKRFRAMIETIQSPP